MGTVHVGSREDRDKLHDYLVKKFGVGAGGNAVSSSGAPPDCSVSYRGVSSSSLASVANRVGINAKAADRAQLHRVLDAVMDRAEAKDFKIPGNYAEIMRRKKEAEIQNANHQDKKKRLAAKLLAAGFTPDEARQYAELASFNIDSKLPADVKKALGRDLRPV